MLGEALAEITLEKAPRPARILYPQRTVEAEPCARTRGVGRRRGRRHQQRGRIAGRRAEEHEGERDDEPQQHERIEQPADEETHRVMMRRRARASTVRRFILALVLGETVGCGASATPVDTVVYASGADLESGNPLITIHPLARQVQRYMLFVTLAKYDSALEPAPYFAREWSWSADRRALTFTLAAGLTWQDGQRTTSRDVAFTINAARDPHT